jgi:hypothetical protein
MIRLARRNPPEHDITLGLGLSTFRCRISGSQKSLEPRDLGFQFRDAEISLDDVERGLDTTWNRSQVTNGLPRSVLPHVRRPVPAHGYASVTGYAPSVNTRAVVT